MDQVQDAELKELYRQYGETAIKLEYFQNKFAEIKNKILQKLDSQNKK